MEKGILGKTSSSPTIDDEEIEQIKAAAQREAELAIHALIQLAEKVIALENRVDELEKIREGLGVEGEDGDNSEQ